tara:strand:+ start:1948 stop:2220 length:273 start_codon:yes stop_codon:yes gene_type:complete
MLFQENKQSKINYWISFIFVSVLMVYAIFDNFSLKKENSDLKKINQKKEETIKSLIEELEFLEFQNEQQFESLKLYEEKYMYLGQNPVIE